MGWKNLVVMFLEAPIAPFGSAIIVVVVVVVPKGAVAESVMFNRWRDAPSSFMLHTFVLVFLVIVTGTGSEGKLPLPSFFGII